MISSSKFQTELSVRDIVFSAIFHTLLITTGLVMSYDTHKKKQAELKVINKKNKIIESAVRIDIVSMPKLTVKELKQIKRVAPPATTGLDPVKVKAVEAKAADGSEKKASEDFQSLLKTLSKEKIDLGSVKKKTKKKGKSKKQISQEKKRRAELKKLVLENIYFLKNDY